MGRTRQSEEEKKARNTRNKPPEQKEIQRTDPVKPPGLSKAASLIWDVEVPALVAKAAVSGEDSFNLGAYCTARAFADKYLAHILKQGEFKEMANGHSFRTPESKAYLYWSQEASRLGELFGFSPKSRKAIGAKLSAGNNGGLKAKAHILKRQS